MAKNEANFDLYIHDLLNDAGIPATAKGSDVLEIRNALKTATKKGTGAAAGYPEFTAVVHDFVIVMEDKPDRHLLALRRDDGTISFDAAAIKKYAVNGALHYARHIIENTGYKRVFAFGNAGDRKHHILQPFFVDENDYTELPEVETFENFAEKNIYEYYERIVRRVEPPKEAELAHILKKAKELNEYLRAYGKLGDDDKSLVVSAILLALRERKMGGFDLNSLNGDTVRTDGAKLYEQLENGLKRAKVKPEVKLQLVLNKFTLIKDSPVLSEKKPDLGKTPLRFFTEYIDKNIYNAVVSNSSEDFLGRFYGEFVSYSGLDGQSLGVVLTPRHITELFCELVDLKPTDVVFDPCCGTGGFLVSAMHKMLDACATDRDRKIIREKRIFGIECKEDMFAIATTNMIMRGDGQSNLICDDFFRQNPHELQLLGEGVTVGLMNPPYSQAKTKETAGLSELCFIRHLLDSITSGGRAAVIVPVSAMIGKTKEDQQIKKDILKHHTLEGVISLNKNTFYRKGTVPCAAVFTTGEPHPADHAVKFINFENDGFEVKKHLGLVETERAKDRRSYMLDCWRGKNTDAPSKFMVSTTVEDTDEWLHSFYYYNDEIPTERDFLNSMADYLTFEFGMVTHGRGYLFKSNDIPQGEDKLQLINNDYSLVSLNNLNWAKFNLCDILPIMQRGKRLKKDNHNIGNKPYISSSALNNGVDNFISNSKGVREFNNCITIANSGSVGKAFYHPYNFIASDHVTKLQNDHINSNMYMFLLPLISRLSEKYNFNHEISDRRIRKEKIVLPITKEGDPDWNFIDRYIQQLKSKLIKEYIKFVQNYE